MFEGKPAEKKSFITGMITGVAVVAVLGGVFLLGKQSGSVKQGGTSGGTSGVANQPSQPNQPRPPEGDPSKIAPVGASDHIRGDKNAKVTMIEYSDFQCPFCARFHDTMTKILADYKGNVRLVYRHFPLRAIHAQAQKAAEASECANEQGKFWEMHDKLFELNKAQNMSPDTMKKAAVDLKLNTGKFNECLDSGKYAARIEQDYQDGIAGGVSGTPGTFVNGQYLAGALPFEEIKPMLDALLQ